MIELVSIAIISSEFNREITAKMLKHAKKHSKRLGLELVAQASVPGAFDMPLAVKKMLEREDIDGVAVIGAVIKGGTKHDELIAYSLANAVIRLSLEYGKPVGFGVMGPGITWKQAEERIEQYAKQSIEAVARVHNTLKEI